MSGKWTEQGVSVLLGIGSNLGDRRRNIADALDLLRASEAVRVVAVSRLFETEPVGGPPQGRYLNGAAEILTSLGPRELLGLIHGIEARLGRVRTVQNAPREIDLDILFYGDLVVRETDLEIPHPRLTERAFVLQPLVEIAPERRHPLTRRTMREHLSLLGEVEGMARTGGRKA
jgi:2-amino-4-hydroxy-6-hydroxymethyldihydropteridine diphosphokinase